jgi:hypothetical protein
MTGFRGITNNKIEYFLKRKIFLGRQEGRKSQLLLREQFVIDMTEDCMGLFHHALLNIHLN